MKNSKADNSWRIKTYKSFLITFLTGLLAGCSPPEARQSTLDTLFNAPIAQTDTDAPPFDFKSFTLIPKAQYQITARVLRTEDYWLDPQADIMPTDVALAWGELAKQEYFEQLHVTQRKRWYYWRAERWFLPRQTIIQSSSNHHLIASNDDIAEVIGNLAKGDVITASGYLVDVVSDKISIDTSLSRKDSGAGACEIFYITEIKQNTIK